jgi:hypothetical protein
MQEQNQNSKQATDKTTSDVDKYARRMAGSVPAASFFNEYAENSVKQPAVTKQDETVAKEKSADFVAAPKPCAL